MQTVIVNRGNNYDLSRFDRKATVATDRARAAKKAKVRANARPKARVSGFAIFSSVVVFVMLISLLFSYVKLTEASDMNRRKQIELEDLNEEIQMLEVSKNQRMGAIQVKQYAETKLGMSKVDKSQIVYVSTSEGDRFEIGSDDNAGTPKLVAGLAKGFSTIIEYIN